MSQVEEFHHHFVNGIPAAFPSSIADCPICPEVENPPTLSSIFERLKEAEKMLMEVRELHRPILEFGVTRCRECRRDWPCDTSWKLDGMESP